MSSGNIDADFQTIILQSEIAALLHDIGKFTKQFVMSKLASQRDPHSWDFLENGTDEENLCIKELRDILNRDASEKWLSVSGSYIKLKTIGDLLRLHHDKNDVIKSYLGWTGGEVLPLALSLLMIADSIDSASSKGGVSFKGTRLSGKAANQKKKTCYLATPFGELGKKIELELDELNTRANAFQKDLIEILQHVDSNDLSSIRTQRVKLLMLMEKTLISVLAETRLPTNDVSLWQHSYSTASIFKAMLARHLILEDFCANEKDKLLHHKEKLSFFGIRWSENELLSRSLRPKDILGRKAKLHDLMVAIKDQIESHFCLGNEVYRDRNGIYFLTPTAQENDRIGIVFVTLIKHLERLLESEDFFAGELPYKILSKEVGIQILGLTDLIAEDGDAATILRSGPRKPKWTKLWKDKKPNMEVCSRCGLRPVELIASGFGSENDEAKVCKFCSKLLKEGEDVRNDSVYVRNVFLTYETDKIPPKDTENQRLALVQGIFDLRPFVSGEAFSSLLARIPEDYNKNPKKDDKSLEVDTWEKMLKAIGTSWNDIKTDEHMISAQRTFQQVFQDKYLGTKGDGRVIGDSEPERVQYYFDEIVLKAPFSSNLDDAQKLAIYALQQHSAPSRIMRIWETTEALGQESVKWCEMNKVNYFPVSLDPGRFLILLPAVNVWEFLSAMYESYIQAAGRVRHLLPFHLSTSVFNKKFPLYVSLDSMQRFAEIQLSGTAPELWRLEKKEATGEFYLLQWRDQRDREVVWRMPATIPNGQPERFFTWFWIEGCNHPVCISDLEEGANAFVWPSTFDYEVLDSSTRRYDIRGGRDGKGRPHLFCGEHGPKPYPLAELETWETHPEIEALKEISPSQMIRLIGFIATLHKEWKGCDDDIIKKQAEDYVRLCLGKKAPKLVEMAVSGALFDIVEWNHFIRK